MQYEGIGLDELLHAAGRLGEEESPVSIVGDSVRVVKKNSRGEWTVYIGEFSEEEWPRRYHVEDLVAAHIGTRRSICWLYSYTITSCYSDMVWLCGRLNIGFGSRNYAFWTRDLALEYVLHHTEFFSKAHRVRAREGRVYEVAQRMYESIAHWSSDSE